MWDQDISKAPRGRTITVMRNTRTKDGMIRVPTQEFESQRVWIATKCGKVMQSYWIPATDKNEGRWGGLGTKEDPIAWQAFVVPVHPLLEPSSAPLSNLDYVKKIANQVAAKTDIPEVAGHWDEADVGGGS